jgi:hypothetical protein
MLSGSGDASLNSASLNSGSIEAGNVPEASSLGQKKLEGALGDGAEEDPPGDLPNSGLADQILQQISSGQLLVVNSRRKNGLILYKSFYAEFAGPGAAVGGEIDRDCVRVIPVGDLSLVQPEEDEDRQKAYLIRRQWIRLTQQMTDNPAPQERVNLIVDQFINYFGADLVKQLPSEAFSGLVGVLPHTVRQVRDSVPLVS